ncbi:MAG: hypothetical protein JRH11_09590 [Deltaproteobacteria bacterium]|nr:hypothetical protein [Deltaproteobacteria bacterium]
MSTTLHIVLAAALLSIGGCGDDTTPTDTGVADTGVADTGAMDSSPTDTGPTDSGSGDTGDAMPPYVPDWSCLGSVTTGTPAATTADVTVTLTDFGASGPAVGASVQYCPWDDIACASPTDTGTTDSMGMVTLTLPTDPNPYWGFVTVNLTGTLLHEYYTSTPVVNDASPSAAIINETAINVIALVLAETQDYDTNGVIGLGALDCASRLSSGMRVELTTGSGTAFYATEDGSFSASLTETSTVGVWGVLNAAPGDFTATAFLGADATPIATINFRVKAGQVASLFMFPTPDGAAYTP